MFFSCSKIRKATDLITKPTAREEYKREFKDAPELFSLWNSQAEKALFDSISISLPYTEKGKFFPRSFPVYSYGVELQEGERLWVKTKTDSADTKVFIDLYRKTGDSIPTFEHIESAETEKTVFTREIEEPGKYKILIQPEIEANSAFQIQIYSEPVYTFPVASKGNEAIQSGWGARRDGGRRSHEGVDIFAPRGTPVVAATEGVVTSTANKGLGGKQVWLRDRDRRNSLYYAHLDSIIAEEGMRVKPGDTLGLVGNTGNARTTPPHLHFGVYKGYRGAINPFPFVFQTEKPKKSETGEFSSSTLLVQATANLRNSPTTESLVLEQAKKGDLLFFLGRTGDWYHIRKGEDSFFIHESLVSPL